MKKTIPNSPDQITEWCRHYLRPYLLSQPAEFWVAHPRAYQKLDKLVERIVRNDVRRRTHKDEIL